MLVKQSLILVLTVSNPHYYYLYNKFSFTCKTLQLCYKLNMKINVKCKITYLFSNFAYRSPYLLSSNHHSILKIKKSIIVCEEGKGRTQNKIVTYLKVKYCGKFANIITDVLLLTEVYEFTFTSYVYKKDTCPKNRTIRKILSIVDLSGRLKNLYRIWDRFCDHISYCFKFHRYPFPFFAHRCSRIT